MIYPSNGLDGGVIFTPPFIVSPGDLVRITSLCPRCLDDPRKARMVGRVYEVDRITSNSDAVYIKPTEELDYTRHAFTYSEIELVYES